MGLIGKLKKRREHKKAQAEKLGLRKQELEDLREKIYEQEHTKTLTKKWRGEAREKAERQIQGRSGRVREAVRSAAKGKGKKETPLVVGLFKKHRRKR